MQIIPFDFSGKTVRILTDDKGNPWWIAVDVCKVLGILNARDAITALKDDEKNTVEISDGTPGNPKKNIINEPGLYRLLLRSTKKRAAKFQRWVFHDVLPTIRKTGSYSVHKQLPQNYEEALEHLLKKVKENKQLKADVVKTTGALKEIASTDGLVCLRDAAKLIGLKPRTLTTILYEDRRLFYSGQKPSRTLIPLHLFYEFALHDVYHK